MSTFERVIHALLFEVIALILFTLVGVFVTDKGLAEMTGLAVALSLIAMAWNFLYNLLFDKVYGTDRLARTFNMRITHGLGFELGMVVLTFPVMMYVLQQSFLEVLLLDMGAVVFFLVYAISFNWAYDVLRASLFPRKA